MGDTLKAWARASKARIETSWAKTEALSVRAKRYKSGTCNETISAGTNDFSITRCIVALQTIDLLDNEKYLKVVENFTMSEWKEVFMNMPDVRKLLWWHRNMYYFSFDYNLLLYSLVFHYIDVIYDYETYIISI